MQIYEIKSRYFLSFNKENIKKCKSTKISSAIFFIILYLLKRHMNLRSASTAIRVTGTPSSSLAMTNSWYCGQVCAERHRDYI